MGSDSVDVDAEALADVRMVTFRLTADTMPELPAGTVSGIVSAMFDFLALGICAAAPQTLTWLLTNPFVPPSVLAGFEHIIDVVESERAPLTVVEMPLTYWRGVRIGAQSERSIFDQPPLTMKIARSQLLHVRELSYTNPFTALVQAPVGDRAASALVEFLNQLLFGRAKRRGDAATATRAEIAAAVEEATMDLSVDEKFLLLDRQQVELDLKREELKQAKLKTERRRFQLADDIRQAQSSAPAVGEPRVVWTEEQAAEFADNVRLVGAVEAMSLIGVTVEIVKEG